MTTSDQIKAVQRHYGLQDDGIAGPKTWDAIYQATVTPISDPRIVTGLASSFADPADVAAFRRCKANRGTDQECFKKGDNGIGCWGDDVTNETIPFVAITPDDMTQFWGSVDAAKHQRISLIVGTQIHECMIGDRMPAKRNVKNGAVVDLAPGAQKLFGLKAPFLKDCSWRPV